jgi:hypothetical protein
VNAGDNDHNALNADDEDDDEGDDTGHLVCDCVDTNPEIHPGAAEICNGIDDNCNGKVDEKLGSTTCGVGECQVTVKNCVKGVPQTCTPKDPTPEICDGKDNNCDGQIDNDPTLDVDHDGFCACAPSVMNGGDKKGYRDNENDENHRFKCDCDDTNAGIYPGAQELCNSLDDNCNGKVDEAFKDLGKKCSLGEGECAAKGVYVCNADGSGTMCNAVVGTPTPEICDGKDNDCDGKIDNGLDVDHDGFCACDPSVVIGGGKQGDKEDKGFECDCNDNDPFVNPKAKEICDGKDNNCNGKLDEAFKKLGGKCSVGKGACEAKGVYVCNADGSDTTCDAVAKAPTTEICDGKDNDCNGKIDDGLKNCGPKGGKD